MTKPKNPDECGIIMPISGIDDCGADHCGDVLELLSEAVKTAGFVPMPVWHDNATEIIQKRIIENIYRVPIAICDVSGHNPNVMFELGMRLAFDKPTIVVSDDRTKIIFDIQGLKHHQYRRDLRLKETREFIDSLSNLIKKKHDESTRENYQSFLKTLGAFKVVAPGTEITTPDEIIMERLDRIDRRITMMSIERSSGRRGYTRGERKTDYCLGRGWTSSKIKKLESKLDELESLPNFSIDSHGPGHFHVEFEESILSSSPRDRNRFLKLRSNGSELIDSDNSGH